ncbi:MAG TPA: tRNA glutamyl-Q(34) synthetase GluQRS, partial [Aggregicoccus sp.]|nr:tRNA glutamyl-Q(34) synthetase GluQRS [Aggregicoccus sp.]
AFALADLRARGLPPERVLGLLAAWSGLGDGSPLSARELVPRFSLARLPRAPVTALQAQLEAALGWR